MTKGRNTTVVGVRLPDDIVKALKVIARRRNKTISELLKPLISGIVYDARKRSWRSKKGIGESPPDLGLYPDYWKD